MNDCVGVSFISGNKVIPASDFNDGFLPAEQSVYEVLRVADGIPLFIEDYLDRLEKTIKISGLNISIGRNDIQRAVYHLISINQNLNGPVKLMLSAPDKMVIYYMKPYLPEPHEYLTGVKTITIREERIHPNAKIWNPALREKIILELKNRSAYEAILINRDGNVTEGGRSNIFFVHADELFTAPASMVLPGITRLKVLDVCRSENIRVNERNIPHQEISQFDAAFLTGTSRKIVPVSLVDNIPFTAGNPLIKKIGIKFDEMVLSYIRRQKSALHNI